MKSNRIVLGLGAVVFAVGTAFASVSSTLASDYVNLPTPRFCTEIAEQACNLQSQTACTVTIKDGNGATIATNTQVYDAAGCVTPKKDSRGNIGTLTVD